jgi:hypothetical protein
VSWLPDKDEVSVIALGVTVTGTLISNQSKISDFRQQWINTLREDAATLIAHTFVVYAASAGENLNESYLQLHQTSARIRLRLNPEEKRTLRVIAAMNEMRAANHTAPPPDFSVLTGRVEEFAAAMQAVLKSEWRGVKWGEPLYRIVRVLVMTVALIWFAVFLWRSFPSILHLMKGW